MSKLEFLNPKEAEKLKKIKVYAVLLYVYVLLLAFVDIC